MTILHVNEEEEHGSSQAASSKSIQFTSNVCPAGPGLEHTCDLPFGFLWTPFASDNHDYNSSYRELEKDAALCLHCMAYRNPFVKAVDVMNGVWICNLCGNRNVSPVEEEGGGRCHKRYLNEALAKQQERNDNHDDDGFEMSEEVYVKLLSSRKKAQRGQSLASGAPKNSTSYVFVVDANIATEEVMHIRNAIEDVLKTLVEDASPEVEDIKVGLVVFQKSVSVYQVGLRGIASADVIFAGDDDDDNDNNDNNAANSEFQSFDGSSDSQPECNESRDSVNHRDLFQTSNSIYFTSIVDDSNAIEEFLHVLTASCGGDSLVDSHGHRSVVKKLSRSEILRLRREARKKNGGNGAKFSNIEKAQVSRTPARNEFRCTGKAMEVALDLAMSAGCVSGRVILFNSGMVNVGPGSMVDPYGPKCYTQRVETSVLIESSDFFRELGSMGIENGIGVDVLCSGVVGVPAFQALVRPSEGYVLLHNAFDSSDFHWRKNLDHVIHKTKIMASWRRAAEFTSLQKESTQQDNYNHCILDLKFSKPLTPVQIMGPGEEYQSQSSDGELSVLPSERQLFAIGATIAAAHGMLASDLPNPNHLLPPLSCRLQFGRWDELSTLSVTLDADESPTDGTCAYVQTICRWMNFSQEDGFRFLTKVTTIRIPVSDGVSDFLSKVQPKATAIIISKEAVLRSSTWVMGIFHNNEADVAGGTEDFDSEAQLGALARTDLDHTIQRISRSYRILAESPSLPSNGDNPISSFTYAFPPNLCPPSFLRLLHHLRRGGILGDGAMLQAAPDDRHFKRDLFLRFPLRHCESMMGPQLWRWREEKIENDLFSSRQHEQSTINKDIEIANDELFSKKIHFKAIPAETLALWDDVILIADLYDNILIWHGHGVDNEKESVKLAMNAMKRLVADQSKHRFPAPEIHYLREGESMSRKLTSRLAPSHKDPLEQQVALCADLAVLSSQQLESVRNKCRYSDTTGDDASFRQWFWKVASASAKVSEVGRTLCESDYS